MKTVKRIVMVSIEGNKDDVKTRRYRDRKYMYSG